MSRTLRAFALVGLTGLLLVGCGSEDPGVAEIERTTIADQSLAIESQLLTEKKLAAFKEGSPERALMDFWAAVQYVDQRAVANAYSPELMEVVGAERVNEVVRRVSPVYRTGTPRIVSVTRNGDEATVRYIAPAQVTAGQAAPNSLTLRTRGDGWEIVYNSALDDELRLSTQTTLQNSIAPGARTFAPRAVSAGDRAAKLQSELNRPSSTTP